MRYCPHCHRINPGRPQFCHFCARTWHIRICPRRHANPPNAQWCGECGSADLSDTAGPRSWVMIALKTALWLLVGLSLYGLIAGLLGLFKPENISHVLPLVLVICLLIFVLKLTVSLLPEFIGISVKRLFGFIRQMLVKAVVWFLGKLWEILR